MAQATCLMVNRTQPGDLHLVRFSPLKCPELKKAGWKRERTKFWILGRVLYLEKGTGVWDKGRVSWHTGSWGDMKVSRAAGKRNTLSS